ncbi:MAG: cytochrome c oxidase assembly protein, partial [Actinomycetes bacterium]
PYYEGVPRPWGPSSALADQRLGGAIMWSSGMMIDALWISVAAWQWIKSEEHKARRVDVAIASGRLAPEG